MILYLENLGLSAGKNRQICHFPLFEKQVGIERRHHVFLDPISRTTLVELDQELFVEPLTMVITGKEIKKVTVKQGKRKLPVQITDDKVLFDFDPYGGMIKVTLKIQK